MGTAYRHVRIGCASAFWGDTETAAQQLMEGGRLDYLVFDYLAEITLAIMAGQKLRNPDMGFATDFVKPVLAPLLAQIKQQGVKVISNAGGINPHACAQSLQNEADNQSVQLKIAVVDGDDLVSKQQAYRDAGLKDMFSHQPIPASVLSMNAYLGVDAIVKALAEGADVVITGRVVDSAVVVAPLVYEFGWSMRDYDKLAQASLAGHIIECGTHCTGGNFTDWHLLQNDFANMGFPIVEVKPSGEFVVSKPLNTGGLISCATVAEQIVYEIGDPHNYLLPDVICDFSAVHLTQLSQDRVAVRGAIGRAPSHQYKVSLTYLDGYKCTTSFFLAGIDAKAKAEAVSQAILRKTNTLFVERGMQPYSDTSVELLGSNATYNEEFFSEDNQSLERINREIVVKISVAHPEKKALSLFTREIAQAATAMAPGLTGLVGGRPSVTPKIGLFSALVDKSDCLPTVSLEGRSWQVSVATSPPPRPPVIIDEPFLITEALTATVPLIKLAWARSGDKGNHSNIGVIAREPDYLNYIEASLTDTAVADYFSHVLATDGCVQSWRLPGFSARNFLLENSLGGGGMSSLRIDPQGKAYAQQLLQFPIKVPMALAERLMPVQG